MTSTTTTTTTTTLTAMLAKHGPNMSADEKKLARTVQGYATRIDELLDAEQQLAVDSIGVETLEGARSSIRVAMALVTAYLASNVP